MTEEIEIITPKDIQSNEIRLFQKKVEVESMSLELENVLKNKEAMNKFLLAWWHSIPSDCTREPKSMRFDRKKLDRINYSLLNKDGIVYGIGCTDIKELEHYLKRANDFLEHQAEIKSFDENADTYDEECDKKLEENKLEQIKAEKELLDLNAVYEEGETHD